MDNDPTEDIFDEPSPGRKVQDLTRRGRFLEDPSESDLRESILREIGLINYEALPVSERKINALAFSLSKALLERINFYNSHYPRLISEPDPNLIGCLAYFIGERFEKPTEEKITDRSRPDSDSGYSIVRTGLADKVYNVPSLRLQGSWDEKVDYDAVLSEGANDTKPKEGKTSSFRDLYVATFAVLTTHIDNADLDFQARNENFADRLAEFGKRYGIETDETKCVIFRDLIGYL